MRFVYSSDKTVKCVTVTGKRKTLKKTLEGVRAILDELEGREKNFGYIRATKSVSESMKAIGSMTHVSYPEYWECVKNGNPNGMTKHKQVVLGSRTTAYQEVEKMVMGTWESSKVGHGVDAKNLSHTNIAVRKVWRVENPILYKQYDTARKRLCLVRADHPYPIINGLYGELEVVTRTLGAYCLVIFH